MVTGCKYLPHVNQTREALHVLIREDNSLVAARSGALRKKDLPAQVGALSASVLRGDSFRTIVCTGSWNCTSNHEFIHSFNKSSSDVFRQSRKPNCTHACVQSHNLPMSGLDDGNRAA